MIENFELLLAAFVLSALIVLMMWPPSLGAVVVTPDGTVMRLPPKEPAWAKNVVFKKGGGGGGSAPDPQIGRAALEEMQLGRDWLAFAKEQFEVGNIRQDELDTLTKQVTEAQLKTQEDANKWASEDRDRYKSTFQPLQDEFIQTAKEYDTPAKQEAMAAEAVADVRQQNAMASDANARTMASMGVNPNSGKWQSTAKAQDTLGALSAAGAANTARQQTRDKALALKADAINMGNGLASSTASAYGIGLNAGNSATGNAGAANANWRGNVGIVGQGYSGAMQGLQGGAGILNQQYGTQVAAQNSARQASSANASGLMSGIGTIAGMAMFSSKEYKEDKRPVDGGDALEAIDSMPVESWKYKDGIGDGAHHIGPYAEDFRKATGKGDGKSIPVVDAIGVTMKAVQELGKKVSNLEKKNG